MDNYLNLLNTVLVTGEMRPDRTGTGTRSVFGVNFSHSMYKGFPLLTTKKLPLRWIFEELKWFLSGSTDVKDLQDKGVTIWDEWATKEQCSKFKRDAGDLGPVYGSLWRSYPIGNIGHRYLGPENNYATIDQIEELINGIKNNPYGRRHIVSGWHPYWAKQVELPPCHTLWQIYCHVNGGISLKLYARSIDIFLGLPFNIASYALLLAMIANVTGRRAQFLNISFCDLHLYINHTDQARQQMDRIPRKLPTLFIKGDSANINDITWEQIELVNYKPYPNIKAPVAV